MGWRLVEISTDEKVTLYLNNLLIKRINERILINVNDIDLIIFNNDRTLISVKLLNALARANASIIFMDSKHEPVSYTIPSSGNHMSLKVLESQIGWTNTYKSNVWQMVVKNKIYSQMKLLELIGNPMSEKMQSLIDNVKPFDITNREGHAAKEYWHHLFGINFNREQKIMTLKNATINSALNYGYALLRSLMIKNIVSSGLDTRISIFHKSFTNFFALASDMMEPFRPIVDLIVYKNRFRENFDSEFKNILLEVFNTKPKIKGKRHYLSSVMKQYVANLVKNRGLEWIELWDL